ncbi:hypothetical protein QJS10_CPB14g00487 [Acorus calamus]|uniref:Uncharacterized protein n=1 Tax=Acorus calamus TaxID=4465 RepID=A0AAV9DAA8_ACOCL|nr:hypothetical protein QJS10_CPB14g00487 [Acorus calamus]
MESFDNGASGPKQPKPLLATIGRVDLMSSVNGCGSGIPLMNRWMRAPYLERELARAGGMRRWLELQGWVSLSEYSRRRTSVNISY